MVLLVKLPPATLARSVQVLDAPVSIQLLASVSGKTTEDGSNAWAPVPVWES